jgi:N-ethylmaleimide reductase
MTAIIADFGAATRNGREAGFDGVELHSLTDLYDQFLQDISNTRTDGWGGTVENRARLILETIEAMAAAWSMDRVGDRLGPSISLYGIDASDPFAIFGYCGARTDRRRFGYLTMLEPNREDLEMVMVDVLSKSRGGALRNPDLPRARPRLPPRL